VLYTFPSFSWALGAAFGGTGEVVALPGVLPLVGVMAAPLEADAAAALALPPPEVGGGAPADDSMDEPPADARFVPETEARLDLRDADFGGILKF